MATSFYFTFDVSAAQLAFQRMPVTKTRRGAKFVVFANVKMSNLGPVALLTFNILFTRANACVCITLRGVIQTSFPVAIATFTSVASQFPMIGSALVTLVSGNSFSALAFALWVTLGHLRA